MAVAAGMIEGLVELHRAGYGHHMVHWDLKPSNILLSRDAGIPRAGPQW